MFTKKFTRIFIMLLCILCMGVTDTTAATPRKKVTRTHKTAKSKPQSYDKMLLGKHKLALQWISWNRFGSATITRGKSKNVYNITGKQDGSTCSNEAQGRRNHDLLSINGTLEVVDSRHLVFRGKIVTRVHHINGGKDVVRDGKFNFVASGKRRYWRLQEMDNPAEDCVDYVDIFF